LNGSLKIAGRFNIYSLLVNYAIIYKPDFAQESPAAALQPTYRWLLARTAPKCGPEEQGISRKQERSEQDGFPNHQQ
jgi:hypothetical protein